MKTFEEFVRYELSSMKESIYIGAITNLCNRKYNFFQVFSNEDRDIVKYMALGRSFDSQLGNRLQRIAMYGARLRYGAKNVPNYIFLNSDEVNNKITYWTYSFNDDLDIANFSNNLQDDENDESEGVGINVYKTQTYYTAKSKQDCVKKIMNNTLIERLKKVIKVQKGIENFQKKEHREIRDEYLKDFENTVLNSIQEFVIEYDKEDKAKRHKQIRKNIKKVKPVDLMFFNEKNELCLFEIKAGGDLDSKNCEKNAEEVNEDREIFKFMPVNSYFATCYNNRGEGDGNTEIINDGVQYRKKRPVGGIFNIYTKKNKSGKYAWADIKGNILVGSVFWDMVLPDGMKFKEFKEMYERVFKEVGIAEMLKGIKFE